MLILPHKEAIILDLEYTDSNLCDASGIFPDIVEIGAIKVTSELLVKDRYEILVRPRNLDHYTHFCVSLTGIKTRDLEAARDFKDVWGSFAEFTEYAKLPLITWGIDSDIAVLKNAYIKRNLGYPHSQITIDAKSVVWAFVAVMGLNIKRWSLDSVCRYFGIERKSKHRAMSDANAVLSIFKELEGFDSSEEFKLIEV
jgi:DNA polymerase III alpha subunit (gram-positive type)